MVVDFLFFFSYVCVELLDVFSTAQSRMGHVSLVGRLTIVANEAYYSCVVCKFYQLVGRVTGCALGVQCVEERQEYTALWSSCVNRKGF